MFIYPAAPVRPAVGRIVGNSPGSHANNIYSPESDKLTEVQLHRRRKGFEYWGGGGARFRILGGGGQGGGVKLFAGCKLIGAPALNSDNIAQLRIQLKRVLFKIHSNKIKVYILHWYLCDLVFTVPRGH